MFKKKPKPAPDEAASPAEPKKRSKLKLALMALAPLVLAGGGYGGWAFFLAAPAEEAHAAAEDHGVDPQKVAALKAAADAETSATYSFALSELIKPDCGIVPAPALKAASEAEAHADGTLVNMSWIAASRRLASVTGKSCGRLRAEVITAEQYAAGKTTKNTPKGGGGH